MNVVRHAQRQSGYALVTSIVFLVLLTLVALAAIRGTGLEVKSTANNTLRAEAFAASEIARTLVSRQIDALCANAGTDGIGTEVDGGSAIALTAIPGLTINDSGNWCVETATPFVASPGAGTPDAVYAREDRPAAHGAVWVQRLYRAPAPGAGQALAAGYGGEGRGAASGGGHIYFHVHSLGTDAPVVAGVAPETGYNTAAIYRYVVRR
jgi:hypothetical protein